MYKGGPAGHKITGTSEKLTLNNWPAAYCIHWYSKWCVMSPTMLCLFLFSFRRVKQMMIGSHYFVMFIYAVRIFPGTYYIFPVKSKSDWLTLFSPLWCYGESLGFQYAFSWKHLGSYDRRGYISLKGWCNIILISCFVNISSFVYIAVRSIK